MSALLRRSLSLVTAAVLTAPFLSANAAFVSFFERNSQANPQLGTPWLPVLSNNVQNAITAFAANTTTLGKHEYEGVSPVSSFIYTGGTATITSGTPVVANGESPDFPGTNGRYNTTVPLPVDENQEPSLGHWLETNLSFDYSFSSAISALSFMTTDLGDFGGQVVVQLFSDSDVNLIDANSNPIFESEQLATDGVNGSLAYFNVRSDNGTTFNRIRFLISQPGAPVDFIGFDSFVVGNGNVIDPPNGTPEPTSLALVGLCLVGLAGSARRRKQG